MSNCNKTLAIFTLVVHKEKDGQLYGYAPYINQISMWTSHFDKIIVVGPFDESKQLGKIDLNYNHRDVNIVKVNAFNIKSIGSVLKLLFSLPLIMVRIYRVMRVSDYLHFRCPSNVSAIAALIQILFPKKPKSVKYAGNWDPNSQQPIGYRFQKWLLTNTFLTKSMKVLVYGKWKNQSKYVIPFSAATYSEAERLPFRKRNYLEKIKFVFIGAMVVGKRPLFTVKVIQSLIEKGFEVELHMYGDGDLKEKIQEYVKINGLNKFIFIYGNKSREEIKESLLNAHFIILPSKSEGWPKAIAEGMFFGAIPISTKISCLPWILDYGKRGILIEPNLDTAVASIIKVFGKGNKYLNEVSKNAQEWSQHYTTDRLEKEIEKVIKE